MLKSTLLSIPILACVLQLSAQNFVLKETTIDRAKAGQFFGTAKRCEMVLRKKGDINTIPFSSNCTLTSTSFGPLADKFLKNLPALKPGTNEEKPIEDDFKDEKKIIRLTYGYLAPDQKSTMEFVQIVIYFDPKSPTPKIDDIQVKNKIDIGGLILSSTQIDKLKKKPEPPKPAPTKKAPVKKAPAKKTTTPAKKK